MAQTKVSGAKFSRGKWWRDPDKERFWRETVETWRRSGLDIRAFCAQRSLAEHNFYAWRRELARRDQEGRDPDAAPTTFARTSTRPTSQPTVKRTAAKRTAAKRTAAGRPAAGSRAARRTRAQQAANGSAAFVPVHVAACSLASIDVLMPGDIVVRVQPGADRTTLRDVLAALAEVHAQGQRSESQRAESQRAEGRPC